MGFDRRSMRDLSIVRAGSVVSESRYKAQIFRGILNAVILDVQHRSGDEIWKHPRDILSVSIR